LLYPGVTPAHHYALLTKDYAAGVSFVGSFDKVHCVPCLVGKDPQQLYAHNAHHASAIAELLHLDICGPYPIETPVGNCYFFPILDDRSNFGFTALLRARSDAFHFYQTTEAYLEHISGLHVRAVRMDGALELTSGDMGAHLKSRGIAVQKTAPYAHSQNGKTERYIRTLEDGGQTLLADAGLPGSFWGDAVLTMQYVRNRAPTSTLPVGITPFEALHGKKPDLSHLRVWGCQCFVAIPGELCDKAGPQRFEAIFVGYEEHRIGWCVRDLQGKYHFSWDIIFNESSSGHLKRLPRSLSPPSDIASRPSRQRILDVAGPQYAEVLDLAHTMRWNRLDCDVPPDSILPPASRVDEPAPAVCRSNRIAACSSSSFLSIPSEFLSADLVSYFAFFPFFNASPPVSLDSLEFDILLSVPYSVSLLSVSLPHEPSSFAVGAPSTVSPSVKWDLKKEPQSYVMPLLGMQPWRARLLV